MVHDTSLDTTSIAELLKFRSVVEQAFSMVMILDAYGRIEYVNPSFTEVTGYSSEDVLGRFIHELGEVDQRVAEDMWSTVAAGKTWRGQFEAPRKSGEKYWVMSSISPLRDDAGTVTGYLTINLDVTDTRRDQEELAQADFKLDLTLGQMPSIMWTTDRDLRVTSLRGAGVERIDLSAAQVIGMTMREFVATSPFVNMIVAAHERAITGESVVYDVPGERTYQVRVEPYRNQDGQIIGCIGVSLDVTEQAQARAVLAEVEERNRSILDNYPDGVVVVVDGTVVYGNPAMTTLTGYSAEEYLGWSTDTFVVPAQQALSRQRTARVLSGNTVTPIEYDLVCKDGSTRPVEVNSRPFSYLGTAAMLTVVRDVTDRRRAQDALRHSEERYRTLYQDNPTMYFTVDEEGIVLSVNLFGAHQLGYQPEELAGRPVTEVFVQEDRRNAVRQLKSALRKPGAVVEWELRKEKRTGEVIWVKETARATLDADGRPIILIVCEDITERRRMEAELQRAREELEKKVEKQLERSNPYGLTFRQLTILHLIADGQSDKEIGTVLGISPLTVAKHVSRVLRRMNASSRTEAGVRAFRERLIT